jgi:hypothetical protein
VKQKLLARADGGSGAWEVNMEIRLYRERPSAQRPGKMIVSRLWEYLEELQKKADKTEEILLITVAGSAPNPG